MADYIGSQRVLLKDLECLIVSENWFYILVLLSKTSFKPKHRSLSSGLKIRALQVTISTEVYQNLNHSQVKKLKHGKGIMMHPVILPSASFLYCRPPSLPLSQASFLPPSLLLSLPLRQPRPRVQSAPHYCCPAYLLLWLWRVDETLPSNSCKYLPHSRLSSPPH